MEKERGGGALLILRLSLGSFSPPTPPTLCCTATHAATKSQETFSSEVIPRNKQSPARVSELPRSVSFWNSECVLPSSPLPQKRFPASLQMPNALGGEECNKNCSFNGIGGLTLHSQYYLWEDVFLRSTCFPLPQHKARPPAPSYPSRWFT